MKAINRTVWILSLVSFFADVASEMLYPIIPVYLQQIGFSVFLIGLLEGVAGFTASLSKGYFGKQSDEKGVRLPFIKWGYFLSALSKPMMTVFIWPLWIFFARTVDRFGKGIRTAARDALLSQNATPQTKATVFGFHRSMDTLGAATGPLISLLLLLFLPNQYTTIFLIAFVPGIIAVLLIYFIKEKKLLPQGERKKDGFFSFVKYWKIATPAYKKLVTGLLLFALFNSSDVFLLLKTKEVTGSDTITIGVYILYNIVFAIASYPLGKLADKFGLKEVFITGISLFAIVYLLFATATSYYIIITAFILYGLYAACTEGVAKAWVTNVSNKNQTATAIGFYTSFESICTLVASITAGLLWSVFNSKIVFLSSSITAVIVIIYFFFIKKTKNS